VVRGIISVIYIISYTRGYPSREIGHTCASTLYNAWLHGRMKTSYLLSICSPPRAETRPRANRRRESCIEPLTTRQLIVT
jgi:hypothetical protein